MTQSIIIGQSGLAGWNILQSTEIKKKEILSNSPDVIKDLSHFKDRIEFTKSADDLIDDHRMLRVALGAFGLRDDTGNRAFIKKILDSDLKDERSFANRLGDKRYRRFAESFEFIGKDIPKGRPRIGFINQVGLERVSKETKNLAIRIENLVNEARTSSDRSIFGSEEADAQGKYNDRTSVEKLLENNDFRKVIKTTLSVDSDFDALPKTEQLRQVMRAAKNEMGVDNYNQLLDPESIGRLVWGYAYNTYNIPEEIDESITSEIDGLQKFDPDQVKKSYSVKLTRNGNLIWDKLAEIRKSNLTSFEFLKKISEDSVLLDSLKVVFNVEDVFFDKTTEEQIEHLSTAVKSDFNLDNFLSLFDEKNLDRYIDKYLENSEKSNLLFVERATLNNYTDKVKNAVLQVRDKIQRIFNQDISDFDKVSALLSDSELSEFFTKTIDLSKDFQEKSKYRQTEELLSAIKSKSGTDDLKAFATLKNLEKNIGVFLFKKRFSESQATENPITKITEGYLEYEFERRIGLGDESMRLALNARRELTRFAREDATDRKLWFEVLANPPLRKVFETAFGFSPAIAKADIDRQRQMFINASQRLLGTASFKEIGRPENTERLIRQYHARSQISFMPMTNRYSAALALFRS